jgi:hypothetical protein
VLGRAYTGTGSNGEVRDGEVQAVQNDRDLLAVLGREDVVEEGGFAGTKVACQRDKSADAEEGRKGLACLSRS